MAEQIEVTAVNRPDTLASPFLSLEERLRTRKNPQGSVAFYQSNLQGNVDATHNMIHKLVVPSEAKKIQQVRIWVYGEKYRGHSIGSVSQTSDTVTSKATIPPSVTSGPSSKSTNDFTLPDTVTSAVSNPTSTASEDHTHTVEVRGYGTGVLPAVGISGNTLRCNDGGSLPASSGGGAHIHSATHHHHCMGSGHLHGMDHTHSCPGSSHSHQVQMMSHLHDLIFGIYEPATATAAIALKIIDSDGIESSLGSMGSGEFSKEDFEVTEYFQKPGVYTVKFEADAIGRVRSIVFAQIYVEPD